MTYIKLEWIEPATAAIEHGIVPIVWLVKVDGYQLLPWPNRTNVQPLIEDRTVPTNEWQIVYALKRLSEPGKGH